MEFAIVDIETTGSNNSTDCITEIGIVISDGEQIIDQYETLVNPGEKIGWYVSKLTGITDEMVANEPDFCEVAHTVHRMLKDRVFVAHNVNFDYNIVKNSLTKCGLDLPHKRLCTLRLSRTILPGYKSYGLGNITQSLGIRLVNAHRAMGDARATAELFHILYKKGVDEIMQAVKSNSREATLPPNLPKSAVDKLPDTPGIYRFYDQLGELLYVGKAKNIKKRVATHFTGVNTIIKRGLLERISDVDCTVTGNEVIAALLEEAEIKQYWPTFNQAQKSQILKYAVYKYFDSSGNIRFAINKIANQHKGLLQFPSLAAARNWLIRKVDDFQLKASLCGFEAYDNDEVSISEHNDNARKFLRKYLLDEPTIVWYGKGRDEQEIGFVLMENGVYLGYGFVDVQENISTVNRLKDFLVNCHDTPQSRRIIGSTKLNKLKKVVVADKCNLIGLQ
jgi:DNA polymerase-3 subunit epsilon